jgi:hypothetical protein
MTSPIEAVPVDTISNADLVLRRNGESLWQDRRGGFITLNKNGGTDYPVRYEDGRIGYDYPETLTKAFRAMVRAYLNSKAARRIQS